jgi:hypothetical protein
MKEAEDIIIAKRFFELTPAEMEAVREFASNEEDYDAMRWFLQSTRTSFANEKIEPSKNLRQGVFAHLNQQPAQKTVWLNGVAAFMFPREKKFYQYPAFQMAAVGLLLVGFVFMYDGTLEDQHHEMAINTTPGSDLEDKAELTESLTGGTTGLQENEKISGELADKDVLPSSSGPAEPFEAVPGDGLATADDNVDDKQLSVAEEARNPVVYNWSTAEPEASIDELSEPGNSTGSFYRADGDKNVIDNTNKVVTINESVNTGYKKDNPGRFENTKTEAGNAAAGGNVITNPAAPADNNSFALGTTTVTGNITVLDSDLAKEKEEKEGGLFLTATAGGVYGDTATMTNGGTEDGVTRPDVDAPATQMSVSESKELKALFFSVK